MSKPRLLDLFCGAGGCAKGYQRAGFYVVGVDINPQPRYCGDEFIQADVMGIPDSFLDEFDAIHASPPCQHYSTTRAINKNKDHAKDYPDLVAAIREKLNKSGKPYIIENVQGAPLLDPVVLCGTMFNLRVLRHRLFETSFFMMGPYHQPHSQEINTLSKDQYSCFSGGATHITVAGHNFNRQDAEIAMNIDWMSKAELAQAIPPAYTEFIGKQIMEYLRARKSA